MSKEKDEHKEVISPLFHSRFKRNPWNPWDPANHSDPRAKSILNKPGGLGCHVTDRSNISDADQNDVDDEEEASHEVKQGARNIQYNAGGGLSANYKGRGVFHHRGRGGCAQPKLSGRGGSGVAQPAKSRGRGHYAPPKPSSRGGSSNRY